VLSLEQAPRKARTEQQQDDQRDATDRVNSRSNSMSGVVNTSEDQLTDKYLSITRKQLIKEQEAHIELHCLIKKAADEEAARYDSCFYIKSGVLMTS